MLLHPIIAYKTNTRRQELEQSFHRRTQARDSNRCWRLIQDPGLAQWIYLEHMRYNMPRSQRQIQRSRRTTGSNRGRCRELAPQAQARYPYRKPYTPPNLNKRSIASKRSTISNQQIAPQQGQRTDRSRITCHHCGKLDTWKRIVEGNWDYV